MADQLPIISGTRAINATATASTSLIGRGLSAIQRKETGLAHSEMDARYRQASDTYNQITNNDYTTDHSLPNEKLARLLVAFDTFQSLADMGYGKAYFRLSRFYCGRRGIPENQELAQRYGRLALTWCFNNQSQNDLEIWSALGFLYRHGIGVEEDNSLAIYWYKKAAEQADVSAQLWLGICYIRQGNEKDGLFWYRQSAEKGFAPAQGLLGRIYMKGTTLGTTRDDEKSVFWYLKAIEQDYSPAIFELGINIYGRGRHGKKQDDEKVAACYRRLAEQGNAIAQFSLGLMYEHGRGVAQDIEQSVFWFSEAAEQNLARAQEKLTNRGINWKDA